MMQAFQLNPSYSLVEGKQTFSASPPLQFSSPNTRYQTISTYTKGSTLKPYHDQ